MYADREWYDITEVKPILDDNVPRQAFLLQCKGDLIPIREYYITAIWDIETKKFYEQMEFNKDNMKIKDNPNYRECLDVLYWSYLTPTRYSKPKKV